MQNHLRLRATLVYLGLYLTFSLPALSAELNLSGTWTATVHIPKVSSSEATLTLEQDGEKLSGTITSSGGRQEALTGTIIGTEIQFSYSTSAIRVRTDSGDKPLTLNFSGTASNDEIEAKAKISFGEATIEAKRK